MSVCKVTTQHVAQNTASIVRIVSDLDTSSDQVAVILTSTDGVVQEAGTSLGSAANDDIDIICDWSLFDPGRYYLEVIADPAGTPKVLIPSSGEVEKYYLVITDKFSLS